MKSLNEFLNESNTNRIIVTRNSGDKYVLQGYEVGTWYLIPYVPHWNGGTSLKYWEPHYAKKETWIPIKDVKWNEFDMSKEEFLEIQKGSSKKSKEILSKYQSSF